MFTLPALRMEPEKTSTIIALSSRAIAQLITMPKQDTRLTIKYLMRLRTKFIQHWKNAQIRRGWYSQVQRLMGLALVYRHLFSDSIYHFVKNVSVTCKYEFFRIITTNLIYIQSVIKKRACFTGSKAKENWILNLS